MTQVIKVPLSRVSDPSAPVVNWSTPVATGGTYNTDQAMIGPSGTASDPETGITLVEISLDNATWSTCSGTTSWSYPGPYFIPMGASTVYARAWNGAHMTATATITVNRYTPVPQGVIAMFNSNTPPSGWVNIEDDVTSPDVRNYFIPGAGTSYAPGSTGGATTVTYANHTHPVSSHTHTLTSASIGASSGFTSSYLSASVTAASSNPDHTHSFSGSLAAPTANTGSGGTQSLDNRPLYYALRYIVRP